jgi:hypothetical protein
VHQDYLIITYLISIADVFQLTMLSVLWHKHCQLASAGTDSASGWLVIKLVYLVFALI